MIEGAGNVRPWQPPAATIAAGPSVAIWRLTLLLAGFALTGVIALAVASRPAPIAAPQGGSSPLPAHAVGGPRLSRPSGDGLTGGLASAASASIGASERSFWAVRHGSSLVTAGGGIHSAFSASGIRVSVAGATLRFRLSSVGRGKRLERPKSAAPSKLAGEVVYEHGSVSEFYRNGPYGLEQGFTLRARQGGAGALLLAMGVSGSLIPEQVGAQILFRTPAGTTALRYGQLRAVDATGRQLPTSMRIDRGTLQLRIDDRGARYPLQIDPFFQQGSKLTGGEESGKGLAGESVSLSADGDTAVVGAPNDNGGAGAAWVFTRSGVTWAQQGPKLLGGEESGTGHFGNDVAVSGDGSTAIIGAPGDNSNAGAAWIFTRSGSTWAQQAPKLTGGEESGAGRFGFRVALSGDGTIATIGGPGDNGGVGAAWAFTRSGSVWEQQAPKLVGGEEVGKGEFGVSVALSSDASSALIGGGGDNSELGAAWVFARSGSTWEQQGSKLTGGGEVGKARFGFRVALSSDASTALIGGGGDNSELGAAWVFARSGSTWEQQGSKLDGRRRGRQRSRRLQRRAVGRREHRPGRRARRRLRSRSGVGVHALGVELGTAGLQAHRRW